MLAEALQPLQQMFIELKKAKATTPYNDVLPQGGEKTVSTIEDPQPSTTSAPDVI